jgi:hypothetical protein
MPIADFADLVSVSLTDAWANEPHDFTPWLAANLDRISKIIGIPLSDPETEVRVDRFSADIVARTPDGDKVLIENQFSKSDHSHLGQIMTYLAGTGAKVIIWIAPDFADAHLSAIRWLNDHTTIDFSFFAVKVAVMQIGGSHLAPLFEAVEQPNNWDRKVQVSLQNGGQKNTVGESGQTPWRKRFWDCYAAKYPALADDRGGGGAGSARWRGITGTDFVISRWISQNNAGVFVRGDRGVSWDSISRFLEDDLEKLEAELGVSASAGSRYPFLKYSDLDISNSEKWDAAIDWLEAETRRYEQVFARFARSSDNQGTK